MAIITISRGSSSMGKAVAEKVAERLNYTIISREVILDASQQFNIPEIKLEKAIHDAPGILERYSHSSHSYIAYFRAALTERIAGGNIVYHGLAGHLLLKGMPDVLKVRITADMERRIQIVMARDGITAPQAQARIIADDKERRKWTKNLYGEDPWDCSLYDLTLRIDQLSVDNAVDFICQAASADGFRPSDKSRQKAKDLALACRIKAELVDEFPSIGVTCEYGNVLIYIKGKDQAAGKLNKRLNAIREATSGIHHLETHAGVVFPPDAV